MLNEGKNSNKTYYKYGKNLIHLFRPFTLILLLSVSILVMTASIIYNHIEFSLNLWIPIIGAGLSLILVNAGSNIINQASDYKSDSISKPYRPIPRGKIRPIDAHSLSFIIFLLALLLALRINTLFGIFIFTIAFFSVTYSLPPRIKKYLFINQIWISIPKGLITILAAWSVFGNPFNSTPIIIGLISTIFLVGGMATKDIIDIEADKKTGIKTLMNTFGTKKTALICLPFLIVPFLLIPFFISLHFLEWYFWPLTFMIIPSCLIFFKMKNVLKNNFLENTSAWSFMYAEYMILALGISLCTIFNNYFFC